MSIFKFLKPVFVMGLGALIGYNTVQFFKAEPKNRFMASQTMSKLGGEQNARDLFEVSLNTDSLATTETDVSVVTVHIEALREMKTGMVYSWNLPNDVIIIEGDPAGNFEPLARNTGRDYKLKIRGFSKQLRKYISFQVQGEHDGKNINRDVLISSRVEDSLEYLVQQNESEKVKNRIFKTGPKGRNTRTHFDLKKVVR